jgi:hypothetical protein
VIMNTFSSTTSRPVGRRALSRKSLFFIAAMLLIAIGLLLAGRYIVPPLYFSYEVHRGTVEKERQLLYKLNHQSFAIQVRDFAESNDWKGAHVGFGFQYYLKSDPEVPEPLRALDPSVIRIFADRVEFECGGAFLSFGLAVFREGFPGGGTKKLDDGVWFYAEDGIVPAP